MNREQRRKLEQELKKAEKKAAAAAGFSVGIKMRHTFGVFDKYGNDITHKRIRRVSDG